MEEIEVEGHEVPRRLPAALVVAEPVRKPTSESNATILYKHSSRRVPVARHERVVDLEPLLRGRQPRVVILDIIK